MLHFHRLVGICPREPVPVTENKGENKKGGGNALRVDGSFTEEG